MIGYRYAGRGCRSAAAGAAGSARFWFILSPPIETGSLSARRLFLAWVGNLRSGLREAMSGINERNMRKGLGKISNQPSGFRRVFLRQQPDVVAQANQSVEKVCVHPQAALSNGRLQPARNCKRGTGPPPVGAHLLRIRLVTPDQAVDNQILLDRRDGRSHPRIISRQKAHHGNAQQAGVRCDRP